MKKIQSVVLLIIIITLTGCSGDIPAGGGSVSVVCCNFAQYDWVREILGDTGGVTLTLLPGGADPHSYQPSAADMIMIAACDIFIYTGGESDEWAAELLAASAAQSSAAQPVAAQSSAAQSSAAQPAVRERIVINLLEILGAGAKYEEIAAGMGTPAGASAEVSAAGELDEHVWLSLRNAELFCEVIAESLSAVDRDNADVYRRNLKNYTEKLRSLDKRFRAAAESAERRIILVGDRFPFRYLTDDYGLDYCAAFPGCSSDTEANFETVIFLARKIDSLGIGSVIVTESSDKSIAKAIIGNTKGKNQEILVFDSMQSATMNNARNGATYLLLMEGNLIALEKALN